MNNSFREQLYILIFGTKTKWGRRFDIILILSIITSVLLAVFDSVLTKYGQFEYGLNLAEWVFTIIFTIEYFLRIYSSPKPLRYMFSFWGIIDFISVIPTYLSIVFIGPEYFATFRIIRILRIFRVLKLTKYLWEAEELGFAVKRGLPKISVFLGSVFVVTIIAGTIMFLIEGPDNGFTNIPTGVYWAIITITTVGYGDIVPVSSLGKLFASFLVILSYGVIAVPVGIISAEMSHKNKVSKFICPNCNTEDHESNSKHCRHCGSELKNER